jgi:hypothetical protein
MSQNQTLQHQGQLVLKRKSLFGDDGHKRVTELFKLVPHG